MAPATPAATAQPCQPEAVRGLPIRTTTTQSVTRPTSCDQPTTAAGGSVLDFRPATKSLVPHRRDEQSARRADTGATVTASLSVHRTPYRHTLVRCEVDH